MEDQADQLTNLLLAVGDRQTNVMNLVIIGTGIGIIASLVVHLLKQNGRLWLGLILVLAAAAAWFLEAHDQKLLFYLVHYFAYVWVAIMANRLLHKPIELVIKTVNEMGKDFEMGGEQGPKNNDADPESPNS